MRVVVVGAGFAGLMTAWRLSQHGCEVVVLEARDRVGGRVWSQELIPHDRRTLIERGAEFVLDGYEVLREVLAELGLNLAGTAMSYHQREPRGGGQVSASEVDDCAAWVAAELQPRPGHPKLGRQARKPLLQRRTLAAQEKRVRVAFYQTGRPEGVSGRHRVPYRVIGHAMAI